MNNHLIILQIIIPLLCAPICALLPSKNKLPWLFSLLVTGITFFISLCLLNDLTSSGESISYNLGGWAAPWGIEYRLDLTSIYVLLIVSSLFFITMLYAGKSIAKEIEARKSGRFYAAILLCQAGLMGIVATGDAFNLFVFLEISSLATYTLIGMGNKRQALTAAFQYLIMGTIGATFILIGVGLLYMMTGTLNMADLADKLVNLEQTRAVHVAIIFIVVGTGLKLALFPLHLWLPNAYTYAPSAITVFLASTATKVAVYILIRFIFSVFDTSFVFSTMPLAEVLIVLAILGMIIPSATAITKRNLKRLLAFSSVAQIGYIILGISLMTVTGLTASLLHLFNHALMKGALFMAVGCMCYRLRSIQLKSLYGLGKYMPWTMAAFVIASLSLIGMPLTVGFISKWYLIQATLEQDAWWLTIIIIISSLMAIIYIWKVVEVAYFRKRLAHQTLPKEAPLALLIPTWLLVIANLYFGIDTSLTINIATDAAQQLLGTINER